MSLVSTGEGMKPYVAFYNGKRVEVHAINALQAQSEAAKVMGVTEKKRHKITVMRADVTHDPAGI